MAKKKKADTGSEPALADLVTSDEGVPCAYIDHEHVVNLTDDDPRNQADHNRRELRIGGKPFMHVRENGDGQWIYHHDAR